MLSYGGRLGYEDAGETANTQVIVHDYGDKTLVFEVRGLQTEPIYKGAKVGVIFEGTDGYVVMTSYDGGAAFDTGRQAWSQKFKGGGDHFGNFIKAVRSRKHRRPERRHSAKGTSRAPCATWATSRTAWASPFRCQRRSPARRRTTSKPRRSSA